MKYTTTTDEQLVSNSVKKYQGIFSVMVILIKVESVTMTVVKSKHAYQSPQKIPIVFFATSVEPPCIS